MKLREGSAWRERIGSRVRVRTRLRSGMLLVRGAWLQILQTAVAAKARIHGYEEELRGRRPSCRWYSPGL